ncbi:MAG: sporulation integral membrane protein YtvI [Lachnospiraceae bacterium]|jgi:sporulation integral membrane protein YtvI|nr:sporulation integral membrane protein YtvI [Lachnospiraceae bacterium]
MERKTIGIENLKLIVNILISLVILLLCIFVVPRLVLFFMPFVIGWIISCIANPLVVFLERKLKIKRKAGIVVVIVCVIAAVIGIGYGLGVILWRQISGFIQEIPTMWEIVKQDFDTFGVWIDQYIGVRSLKFADALNNLGNIIGEMITNLPKSFNFSTFEGMGSMVGNIASVIISIIMCMLSAYFFIADRDWLGSFLNKVLPENIIHKYDVFASSLKQAVGGYFKAQFRIEIWMYILLLIGLTVLKVRYGLLIALLIAFLDFLPFFGTGIVLIPWAIVNVIGGNYLRALGFLIIWGSGQLFRQLIQPKIMGDSIGMEPIPTLFLLFVGYRLAGVGGMLVAVPIGIIVVNMNEAGFFDTPKYSIRLLVQNINQFRQLNEDEIRKLDKKDN